MWWYGLAIFNPLESTVKPQNVIDYSCIIKVQLEPINLIVYEIHQLIIVAALKDEV